MPSGDDVALAAALTELIQDPTPLHEVRARPARVGTFPAYLDALKTYYLEAAAFRSSDRLAALAPAREGSASS